VQRPPTVVLAEPDLPAQALLSEVFAARGERLLSKGAPAVALEVLRDQPAGILVVSVDRDLSREEHALLHEARRSSPRMVVLATATRPDLGRTLEALRVGATALLHKPLADLPTLLATIQRACDGA